MKKYIAIITAMEEEMQEIKNIMKEVKTEEYNELKIYKGKINKKECILVKSGVGKVNAARTTQVLIDKYDIEYVINAGSAGAINGLLNIGDIVVGKSVVQHDFDITAFGHSKGYITGVGDRIICDRDIIKGLEETIKMIEKRDKEKFKMKLGIVATGDIFCTKPEMKDKIRAKFDADIVDMECGAMAQVCYLDKVPFVVIRSVSDTPNNNNAKTFDENLELASKRCAYLLNEFLK